MSTSSRSRTIAFLLVMPCVAAWSFIPLIGQLNSEVLDTHQLMFWSSVLSLIVLLIASAMAGQLTTITKYSMRQVAAIATLGMAGAHVYYVLLYRAYKSAADGSLEVLVVQYTWPLFVVVFARVLLKETVTQKHLVAIAIGIVAVALSGYARVLHRTADHQALLTVCAAAALFGMFSTVSRKANYEAFSGTTICFAGATVSSLMAMLFWSEPKVPPMAAWGYVLANGIIINGLSYVLWLKALQHAPASFVAPFVFFTPVCAAILLFMFGRVLWSEFHVAGLIAVIIAGLLTSRADAPAS